jgi:hypothetical protein
VKSCETSDTTKQITLNYVQIRDCHLVNERGKIEKQKRSKTKEKNNSTWKFKMVLLRTAKRCREAKKVLRRGKSFQGLFFSDF